MEPFAAMPQFSRYFSFFTSSWPGTRGPWPIPRELRMFAPNPPTSDRYPLSFFRIFPSSRPRSRKATAVNRIPHPLQIAGISPYPFPLPNLEPILKPHSVTLIPKRPCHPEPLPYIPKIPKTAVFVNLGTGCRRLPIPKIPKSL